MWNDEGESQDQRDLIIFEMANNHNGDMDHAAKLIEALGKIAREYGIRAGVKVQLRHLDTFIHQSVAVPGANESSPAHVTRFQQTRLEAKDFCQIADWTRAAGLIPIATVFDEESVALFHQANFEILKIASCSAKDYPLLRTLAAQIDRPIVLSTASLSQEEVARAYEILHRPARSMAILHCVALYPTPPECMMLNRIDELRQSFPNSPIGFSSHEHPDDLTSVQLAVAKGARVFEKHVDLPSAQYKINAYSCTPEQIRTWLNAYRAAKSACSLQEQAAIRARENASLLTLKRAAFMRRSLPAGHVLQPDDIQLAIPAQVGQVLAEDFPRPDELRVLKTDVQQGAPLLTKDVAFGNEGGWLEEAPRFARRALDVVKAAGITLPQDCEVELSHHYGGAQFQSVGAVLITVLRQAYCKKLIVMFAGQTHPPHFHPDREESLCLVRGQARLILDQQNIEMDVGTYYHLNRNVTHEIVAITDCVIEEISILAQELSGRYIDESINRQERRQRKTLFGAAINKLTFLEPNEHPRDQPRDLE